MITKIQNSYYVKHVAVMLAACVLFMSFKMHGDGTVVLTAGTFITLETVNNISTETATVGQNVEFRVKNDVLVDNVVVIKGGTSAKGQVVRSQRPKGIGKEGSIEIQVRSVKAVDGQEIALSDGNASQVGDDRETEAIVLGVVVCLLFLTLKGKHAEIPSGYDVNSTVASTTTIKI